MFVSQIYNLRAHQKNNTPLFRLDATFYMEKNRFYDGFISFHSINYKNHYIGHREYTLKIAIANDSELHKNDASFNVR